MVLHVIFGLLAPVNNTTGTEVYASEKYDIMDSNRDFQVIALYMMYAHAIRMKLVHLRM